MPNTIKTDRVNFEKLLNGIDPVKEILESPIVIPNQQSSVDSASAAELMNVKSFEYDYEGTRKGLRKKARKTVLDMVNHVVPDDMINAEYIQNKIEQDIESLTELYVQLENNKVMQRSLIEEVSRGNITPRMYEVFGQMTDKIQAISKQIIDTEQRARKTYVDLKYEIRDKVNENITSQQRSIGNDMQTGTGTIITSTKSLIISAKKKHIEQLLDAKETDYEE